MNQLYYLHILDDLYYSLNCDIVSFQYVHIVYQ
nr:MAG TPA: hypothetical protein [Caudoviricetes sp.]